MIEPLTIVVPYKLWGELHYQSKLQQQQQQQDKKQQQARRAVRVLNQAIQQEQERQLDQRSTGSGGVTDATALNPTITRVAIRSQSRVEMNRASIDFGLNISGAVNDDHILCCARAEQKRLAERRSEIGGPSSVGGVVLLTLDNVLSGKARADRVTAYTPADFLDYYRRREASLRERMQQQVVPFSSTR